MRPPVIMARRLAKTYRDGDVDLPVLRGIDLVVTPGEVVTIVGRSGCGKSTLLQLLGLLDRPTSGELRLDGHPVSELSERARDKLRARKIGFIFQNYPLLDDLNVLENVALGRAMALGGGLGRSNRHAAAKVVDRLGLTRRQRARPPELSGGERQRTAAARALAGDPAILLCDEPTGSLDPDTGYVLMAEFHAAVRERGTAMILVTHDPMIAATARRRLHMENGVLACLSP